MRPTKKRTATLRKPCCVAQPDGVYVYDGGGVESVKLFSHAGEYIRTVYPFQANQVGKVKVLAMNTFADGHKVPALPITSVWWSGEEMGRMAVDVLQRIVHGEARGRHVLRVATELVDRGSVSDTRSGAASGSDTHAESRTNDRMRTR